MYEIGDKLEIVWQDPDYKRKSNAQKRIGTIIDITNNLVVIEFNYKSNCGSFKECFRIDELEEYISDCKKNTLNR